MQNNTGTVNGVLEVFQRFRMAPTAIDQYEQIGKNILQNKLASFVDAGKTINFVMLGYPMKSPNDRDKVIGKLPDLAEQVSLLNFANFNERVKQVYSPGVKITIVSDGYVFNDIMEVPDNTVAEYLERNEALKERAPIEFLTLQDFYKEVNLPTMREKVISQFGITP